MFPTTLFFFPSRQHHGGPDSDSNKKGREGAEQRTAPLNGRGPPRATTRRGEGASDAAGAMADSDGEFVADDLSSDDLADHQVTGGGADGDDDDDNGRGGGRRHQQHHHHVRSSGGGGGGGGGRAVGGRRGAAAASSASAAAARRRKKVREGEQAAWETVKRSWDVVGEGEDGLLPAAELLEAEKRRRLLRDTTPLQRGIIRHVMLVLDMSFAMAAKDYLPTYHRAAVALAVEFARQFFEQNPISQLGIVAMRDGVAVRVSDMGGNPAEHVERLREWEAADPQGNPSLQNALEMCRGALLSVSPQQQPPPPPPLSSPPPLYLSVCLC